MANRNAPRGFTPIKNDAGRPSYGILRRYYKDATAGQIGEGDPVIRVVGSSDPLGSAECIRATTGGAISGVVVSIEPNRDNLSKNYLAAADVGYVYVECDVDALYEVQEGGSGTQLTIADIGKHINSVAAINCDTVTGRSKYEIDNNAKSTGNTWILVELKNSPDNAVGQYAKWIVKANLHTEVNASATNRTET